MTPSPDPAKLVIFSNKKGCANFPEGICPGVTSVRLLPPETSELRTDIGSTVARVVDTQSLAQAGLLGLKFASVDPAGVAWTCHLRETEVLRPPGPYGAPGLRTPMIARSVVGSPGRILNRAASSGNFVR